MQRVRVRLEKVPKVLLPDLAIEKKKGQPVTVGLFRFGGAGGI
jgi:hypothetical protein